MFKAISGIAADVVCRTQASALALDKYSSARRNWAEAPQFPKGPVAAALFDGAGYALGNPCFRKPNMDRYLNLRAQTMHQTARAAKDGQLSILPRDYKNMMLGQSSRIPKIFTEKGRIRVPPNGATEWDGLGSPDLWDAVCFVWAIMLLRQTASRSPSPRAWMRCSRTCDVGTPKVHMPDAKTR